MWSVSLLLADQMSTSEVSRQAATIRSLKTEVDTLQDQIRGLQDRSVLIFIHSSWDKSFVLFAVSSSSDSVFRFLRQSICCAQLFVSDFQERSVDLTSIFSSEDKSLAESYLKGVGKRFSLNHHEINTAVWEGGGGVCGVGLIHMDASWKWQASCLLMRLQNEMAWKNAFSNKDQNLMMIWATALMF